MRVALRTCVLVAATVAVLPAARLVFSDLPAIPGRGPARGAAMCVVEDRLVVLGGLAGSSGAPAMDAWILDGRAREWRKTTSLPRAAAFMAVACSGDRAAVLGGAQGSREAPLATVHRLRLDRGELSYEALPDLPIPVAHGAAAWLGGVLYLVVGGGSVGTGEVEVSLWSLDIEARRPQWDRREALARPPRESPSLIERDGALLLIGGQGLSLAAETPADSHRYAPSDGWSARARAPFDLGSGGAAPLGSSHVAVVDSRTGLVAAYHSITDTWAELGRASGLQGLIVTASWDGAIVLAGLDTESRPRLLLMDVDPQPSGFRPVDYAALASYFAVLVMMGLYFARKGTSTEDFFVAGRRMPWWAAGLSIFGTQLSSISFMAIPAKVYATDWVYFLLQMTIIMVAFPVVFFYLPHFRKSPMTSAYEYLESRFNLPVRMYASVSFVLYQLGRMAIVLFLPAIALSTVTGISVYACILIMGALSTLYTVIGGIRAVIWTDVVQVFVLYGGALLSLAILVAKTDGGLGGIVAAGLEHDKFHMFNWTWDWTTTAVWVVVVGNFFLNLVPYTSDQAVVQRYFTTRDEKAAARSIWTNAALLLPSTLTLFLLGTGLWAFYRANPGLLDPTQPTDSIFPLFIAQQLPAGVAGLLIAAVFAASMSTLDSSLNSVSAALVTDFYARFRPAATDTARLWLARGLTAGLGVLATSTSIVLATFDVGSLWDTFQGMMGLLGGGLAGLFALGVFFPSANGRGAMTGAVASVFILFWVQQHTDLHFFLYGAVGILSCVGIALISSPAYGRSRV
ncbi:MAG: sodium/solute symporter [Bryobacterales bacterium]|nr:sodium/solute symporter [Bryobacterales bacterium]